ncbi:hypothetical protein K502DRAFT_324719 [Neoconidiobolus thromboides FSU 785]|nr:hypothetical protein K502DRAFT_324719 [Neoconidiobolus thromboides FSU 785]
MDENKKVVVACDQCRKNKKKCSGGPPPCESCQLKKIECFIPEERKKNKRLIEISEKLQELELEFQKLPSPESVNRSGSEPLIESSFNLNSLIIKPIYYHLVDCYLNTVQKLKPFISLTRINKELNSDPEKSPLINSICCIAYKYSNSLNSLIQPQTPSNCNSVFYERAIGILSSGKYESSIELVQSYLILSSYMSSFCLNEKSDSYLASAISIAKILGLHDQSWYFSDPSTHTEEKFEGAATWAICYYIDSNNAILLGKPYIMTYHMDGDNSDKVLLFKN